LLEHLLMNKYATKSAGFRVLVWLLWFVVVWAGVVSVCGERIRVSDAPLLGVVCHDTRKSGFLFPWQRGERVKKWALHRYRVWRARYREARRVARLARIQLRVVTSMAQVVDLLTRSQLRYQLGALPVLYTVLETLQVRQIINRHCPTRADVDQGTVALVLVLNRLMLPLPLVQIRDWVGQTVLTAHLGIEAAKFNDDRLGRTLDALSPHLDVIWQEIVAIALTKAQIDLSVLFYDLTGLVGHGQYEGSELMDFGFAHNTPSHKRKLKLGADVSADGNIPIAYAPWSGRTADQATVMSNMEKLARWLRHHGHADQGSLIVGDRAMLNAEIAIAYDKHHLRHLTGLKATTPQLKALVSIWSDKQMEAYPIEAGASPRYWGRGTQITFTHAGKSVTHKALVVVSGPLRDQLRQSRQKMLDTLVAELESLRTRIGQPRLTTVQLVQRSANARLRTSKGAAFVQATAYETPAGQVNLVWAVNTEALAQAERMDGRYLLVTNDWRLSHHEMLRLYRAKDGVETCFHIAKDDLALSPLYLHQDQRIAAMIFVNMVALLTYNLLQRQLQQQGLQMTTRRLIERLQHLSVIETRCWDGSALRRLTPVDVELMGILNQVAGALDQLVQTVAGPTADPLLLDRPPTRLLSQSC
jgi:transposase